MRPDAPGQTRPVLVIDDDPVLCELVDLVLRGEDFEVLSASDGPSGLELARAAQPAVIVLDMLMPDIDGISSLQALKRDPVLKDIPVIGMTGSTDLTYTAKAFRAGADFFLMKPFGLGTLLHVVGLAAKEPQPERGTRVFPRFPAEIPVACVVGGETETTREVVGHTRDVSLGGLLIILPESLPWGTPVRVQLRLPDGCVTADGIVIRQESQSTGDAKPPHGIRLLRFAEDADLVQYRRFLCQIAATNPARP